MRKATYDDGRETILITGATGTIGRALLGELIGHPQLRLRAFTRNPSARVPDSVELCVGDFEDEPSLARAMTNASRLFLLTTGIDLAAHDARAIRAACNAGVAHVVKLSVLGVGRGASDLISQWHHAGEQHLRDSGVEWTMLRPTGFMSNALEWAHSIRATGTVAAPFPDGRTALIDPRDIARVAAVALRQPGHHGRAYELTGPEALSPGDQVRILSEVLGRSLSYVPRSPQEAKSAMEQYGMPTALADAIIQLLASAHEPYNGQPLSTVYELTGREAVSFRRWANDHRDGFVA